VAGDRSRRSNVGGRTGGKIKQTRYAIETFALSLLLTTALIGAAYASAEEPLQSQGLPTSADYTQAIEDGGSDFPEGQETNIEAAQNLPHQNLGRDEALELLQGVFPDQLEAPAGIFDELSVERFLAPNVAVIAGDGPPIFVPAAPVEDLEPVESSPEPATEKEELRAQAPSSDQEEDANFNGGDGHGVLEGGTLLESSIPLRTETLSGEPSVVDLSLERADGTIEPANALAQVDIPEQLGEGIELPEQGITIHLAGAPEDRVATIAGQSIGFLPNVATDTDLAIAPTPTGVETLTQIRSGDAPHSQTFNLSLPAGAVLQSSDSGGATVTQGDQTLIDVAAPTAIDATGATIPVALTVSGDSLTLVMSPDDSTAYPVLVDPLYQTYEWSKLTESGKTGICNNSFEAQSGMWSCSTHEEWSYESFMANYPSGKVTLRNNYPNSTHPGLSISTEGTLTVGDRGAINYTVPRFFTDQETYGVAPTSFISHMTLSGLEWTAWSNHLSPYLSAGIWDTVNKGWVQYFTHEGLVGHGLTDLAYRYELDNPAPNKNAKVAAVSINATETQPLSTTRVFVTYSSLALGDLDVPGLMVTGPSTWVNQTAPPLTFTVSDSGLGTKYLTAFDQFETSHSWTISRSCIGVADSACPRTWKSTDTGSPALVYQPSVLPQGVNKLAVFAQDALYNYSAPAYAEVKVDHSAPEVTLSGSMTEQATLGTQRPTYTIKATTTDGTTEQPRSGVAKALIEVDGQVVAKSEPGCATQNCQIPLEWTLESTKYSAGQHNVTVTATDAVGLSTIKPLTITLQPSPPSVALSGTMTEQGTLGTSRPRYKLKVNSSAEAGLETAPAAPSYSSAFGSSGSGNGQLASPGDVAQDSKGNLWVVNKGNNRIEKFNEKGEYLTKFGTYGAATGQFNRPTSIAIDAKGNFWVTDAGNNRIQEFNESGVFLKAVGSYGAGNGQFSGPEGIAIDGKGNLWISDTYNARLQKFNENGEFIKVVGTRGSATGQLVEPTGIDIGPGGNVWVADWANNRVEVYTEEGAYVRQFGSFGAGNGQFNHPDALTIDTKGNVWVGDQTNGRVEQFNQNGEYVAKFGSAGTGTGQFSFSYPMGIAADSKGNLWIADTNNARIQKWVNPGYVPAYSSSFGTTGTGNGQFNHPAGIAVYKGSVWVVDEINNRVEKFNEAGEYLGKFGSTGSANGQFSRPTSIAADAKGNLWVTDAGNSRIQEFNEKGEFLKAVGAYGTGNGQFNGAEGIAIDGKGNLWVGDTYNGRLQEFNEKGEFIKVVSSRGAGAGQLGEPTGLDIAADGSVWVADWQYNRVVVFNEAGTFVRQFGTEGTGNGQFKRPDVIEVDSKGTVWVGDQNNARIQGFSQGGQYITQFGAAGSGQAQFSFGYPMGIGSDAKGNLWIADTGNGRVQHWTQAQWHSEVTSEIRIDGKLVDSSMTGCATDHCAIAREWTLTSSAYTPGTHTVIAKAIDGLGNTTSKTLAISVQPDTVKPAIQSSGALVTAPEGWVEQKTLGINASATDGGYGVTSLVLRLDGVQVASSSQTCADGGCGASISKSIDMNTYPGGAHSAELIASDGAGNSATKSWTINVDPDGQISINEAVATLEAADETSEDTLLSSPTEIVSPVEGADGYNVGVVESGGYVNSTGAADPSKISTTPSGGFTVELPETSIVAKPTVVGAGATAITDAAGAVGLGSNTTANTDSISRPIYDGLLSFRSIRDGSASETYSWEVQIPAGQKLRLVDSQHAEVDFSDGSEAFLISAEPAHDAVGTSVPTHIAISEGKIVTLTVEHHAGTFVYPVIAGAGWEGGFTTTEVPTPPDEQEVKEEEERILREEIEANEQAQSEQYEEGTNIGSVLTVDPPVPTNFSDAGVEDLAAWRGRIQRRGVHWTRCVYLFEPPHVQLDSWERCGNPFNNDGGGGRVALEYAIRASYYTVLGEWAKHKGSPTENVACAQVRDGAHIDDQGIVGSDYFIFPAERCVWWGKTVGSEPTIAYYGKHLTPYGEWHWGVGHTGRWLNHYSGLALYIWGGSPDGHVGRHATTCIDC
jgi:tripartite motif-containing protein 71